MPVQALFTCTAAWLRAKEIKPGVYAHPNPPAPRSSMVWLRGKGTGGRVRR